MTTKRSVSCLLRAISSFDANASRAILLSTIFIEEAIHVEDCFARVASMVVFRIKRIDDLGSLANLADESLLRAERAAENVFASKSDRLLHGQYQLPISNLY